jgi:hypothetical protein
MRPLLFVALSVCVLVQCIHASASATFERLFEITQDHDNRPASKSDPIMEKQIAIISVAWYEPRLGAVCFSWEKGTRSNTTSSDLAAGFTSLLAPASGVIGITDFTDELSNPPPDRKNK